MILIRDVDSRHSEFSAIFNGASFSGGDVSEIQIECETFRPELKYNAKQGVCASNDQYRRY